MPRSRRLSLGQRATRAVRRLLVVVLLAGAAWFAWQAWTWPDVAALASRPPATTAFIERWRATQRAAGRNDRIERMWVPYARISPNLKRAVLVAEDVNFFSHTGFDLGEIRQAIGTAIDEGVAPRGASTITQQLAKNLWLSPSRNPLRKVKEAILTWQLERSLTKRRILEIYLNVVELGEGIYGAEAAARHYYGKSARSLTEHQAAELAASLPRPKSWHPGSKSKGYQSKVRSIQRRMAKAGWLRSRV